SGNRATGTFTALPQTLVVMQRTAPAQSVVAYLNPGQQLHPDAVGRVTTVLVRGLQPNGDGSIAGDVVPPENIGDAAFYPVLEAGAGVGGSLASVDAILASSA